MYDTETIIHYTRFLPLQSVLRIQEDHARYSFWRGYHLKTYKSSIIRANRAQIYNYYLLANNNRIWRCLSLAMLRRVIQSVLCRWLSARVSPREWQQNEVCAMLCLYKNNQVLVSYTGQIIVTKFNAL